jgi:hypothetical protein
VFDDQAQEVHIRVQARSGAADGEFGEAIIRGWTGVRRAAQSALQVEGAIKQAWGKGLCGSGRRSEVAMR